MAELFDLREIEERVVLAAVSTQEGEAAASSLDELEELARTAGAVCVAKVVQNRESIHPGTYLGKGKLDEVKELVWELGATGVICDDELSPAQLKNLEEALDTKVMDRTMVILDIFASRAHTREGKIQVELAQLRYRAARLVGMRASLSRLGGGIGTRGPGEKKLEMDRRQLSAADHTWNSAVYGNQSACAYLSAGITMSANYDELKIERTIYAKGNGK